MLSRVLGSTNHDSEDMRVTGGRAKGCRLAAFRGLDIRPTSDLVREAIFDLVGQDWKGAKVLDLFAGTGSLGIEALSRGASWALFIDSSRKSIDLVKKNLKICGFEGRGFTFRGDLAEGLPKKPFRKEKKIHLVFVDPPYEKGLVNSVLLDLTGKDLLGVFSTVVVETRKNEALLEDVGPLQLVKSRTYGETKIHIFYREGEG
jgi:16S rRNA (guanine966-N2)-methyltransferase